MMMTHRALFTVCTTACKKVSPHELAIASSSACSARQTRLHSGNASRYLSAIGATKRAYSQPTFKSLHPVPRPLKLLASNSLERYIDTNTISDIIVSSQLSTLKLIFYHI